MYVDMYYENKKSINALKSQVYAYRTYSVHLLNYPLLLPVRIHLARTRSFFFLFYIVYTYDAPAMTKSNTWY